MQRGGEQVGRAATSRVSIGGIERHQLTQGADGISPTVCPKVRHAFGKQLGQPLLPLGFGRSRLDTLGHLFVGSAAFLQ
jgi:hypothetical protein